MVLKLSLVPQITTNTTAIEAATTYRDLYLEMDELKALLAVARDELLAVASVARQQQLLAGESVDTVRYQTDSGAEVLVVHQERFKAIPIENVDQLKEAFGGQYDLLCEETETVKLKSGVTLASLRNELGPRAFDALEKRINVKRTVAPRKGVTARLAAMYVAGELETAHNLATLLRATPWSPQVRTK